MFRLTKTDWGRCSLSLARSRILDSHSVLMQECLKRACHSDTIVERRIRRKLKTASRDKRGREVVPKEGGRKWQSLKSMRRARKVRPRKLTERQPRTDVTRAHW